MDKHLMIAAAFGVGVVAAGAVYVLMGRKVVREKPKKPTSCFLSKEKLLLVLADSVDETRAALREVFAFAEDLQRRGVTPAEVQTYAKQMFAQLLAQGDAKAFGKHGVTSRMVERAVAVYESDRGVMTQIAMLDQMLDSLEPQKAEELPEGWTEGQFAELMTELMQGQSDVLTRVGDRLRREVQARRGTQQQYLEALSTEVASDMDATKAAMLEEAGLTNPQFALCLETFRGNAEVQKALAEHYEVAKKVQSWP
mmetsp:Transcript_20304/g.71807  ORF Transcript_20304/g.71807 Transcript_20304/m.71807 type:complete len:254 (-) Transcript_20304:41-802(-)